MPNLNLPILEKLSNRKSILIAGMGGGFDIFCGLPLYYELRQLGKTVHLANYSFSLLAGIDDGIHLSQSVVGVKADHKSWYQYFPELYLTQWFREKHGDELTIWCFQKTGVRPLLDSYQELVDHLKIDVILLIDGGVDSLLRGNEAAIGTLLEDSISLCAVNALKKVPVRLIACLGMGAEQEIPYAQIFENIAALTKSDSLLGTCSLLKTMEAYQYYQDAVSYVYDKPQQEPSVINASVISAVEGEFGNYHLTQKTRGSKLWISPLMPIYWFFDLKAVAKHNLLLSELRWTDSLSDAFRAMYSALSTLPKRKSTKIQLG